MKSLIAVIGDTHARIDLAAEGLERIEAELDRPVDQVFSVGDLGLFLDEKDWDFLTGPKKYRHPENSKKIRAAWKNWRWPLSAIAGNHEPLHRLRDFNARYFDEKLNYTNAGELLHSLPGLRVVGLSGIFHPEGNRMEPWSEMVRLVAANRVSKKLLAYYREAEVEHVKECEAHPHLLVLHDWPVRPPHIEDEGRRPEAEIVEVLRPAVVCCGHHHRQSRFTIGETEGFALNIISGQEDRHLINAGWCALFECEAGKISFLNTWPQLSR